MDFGLSDDQKLLEETVRGFLSGTVPIERVRELRDLDCPNDRATWTALAELGATGVLVPERFGGSDLSLLDACLISQSLGHAVTPTPFLSSAVIVPVVLREIESPRVEAWLRGIALGELVVAAVALGDAVLLHGRLRVARSSRPFWRSISPGASPGPSSNMIRASTPRQNQEVPVSSSGSRRTGCWSPSCSETRPPSRLTTSGCKGPREYSPSTRSIRSGVGSPAR